MQESWHKKVLREYRDELINAAFVAFIAAIGCGMIYFFLGHSYELRQVNIPAPTLTLRLLSGLVFSSLGRILYKLKFYLILKAIVVGIFRAWWLYNAIKKIIWYILTFIMGFYIVPWFMDALNFILTVLLNAAMIVVYASPFVGVFVVVFLPTFYLLKKTRNQGE